MCVCVCVCVCTLMCTCAVHIPDMAVNSLPAWCGLMSAEAHYERVHVLEVSIFAHGPLSTTA